MVHHIEITDWNNVRIDVKQAREKARKSYVYFPNSGRLYNVGYHNAIYIYDKYIIMQS